MEVFTIGHSTLDLSEFIRALESQSIDAVADVRSSPYSRNFPQFNREPLKDALSSAKISYVFLGKELGGRPKDDALYTSGVADYQKMARTNLFKSGMERVEEGAKKYRIALMCSERNPLDCHRCLLVGRELSKRGYVIKHIMPGFQNSTQTDIERDLLKFINKAEDDMFISNEERLDEAYKHRARRVAYTELTDAQSKSAAAE